MALVIAITSLGVRQVKHRMLYGCPSVAAVGFGGTELHLHGSVLPECMSLPVWQGYFTSGSDHVSHATVVGMCTQPRSNRLDHIRHHLHYIHRPSSSDSGLCVLYRTREVARTPSILQRKRNHLSCPTGWSVQSASICLLPRLPASSPPLLLFCTGGV